MFIINYLYAQLAFLVYGFVLAFFSLTCGFPHSLAFGFGIFRDELDFNPTQQSKGCCIMVLCVFVFRLVILKVCYVVSSSVVQFPMQRCYKSYLFIYLFFLYNVNYTSFHQEAFETRCSYSDLAFI